MVIYKWNIQYTNEIWFYKIYKAKEIGQSVWHRFTCVTAVSDGRLKKRQNLKHVGFLKLKENNTNACEVTEIKLGSASQQE